MARRLRSRVHGHNVTGHLLAHKQTHGQVSHHHTPDMKVHPRANARGDAVPPKAPRQNLPRPNCLRRLASQTTMDNSKFVQICYRLFVAVCHQSERVISVNSSSKKRTSRNTHCQKTKLISLLLTLMIEKQPRDIASSSSKNASTKQ